MKPLIIIPDGTQKTITLTVDDFKKIISDTWEAGYKEGKDNIDRTIVNNLATYTGQPETISPYYIPCSCTSSDSSTSSATAKNCSNKATEKISTKRLFEADNLHKKTVCNKDSNNVW